MNKEFEIFSLYWDNGEYLANSHKTVMEYFNIPVTYHHINGADHGLWMDYVMDTSTSDIVGFIDIDCVPLNKEIIISSIDYVKKYKSMIGTAQSANHIFPYSHICACAVFYFIDRTFWEGLGKPSFVANYRGDVSEEISWLAEEKKIPYKAIYPNSFEKEPDGGVWRLGNYGFYGIGTIFDNSIYHLYQGRYQKNAELFKTRCDEIIKGTFDSSLFFKSTDDYFGNICR